MPSRLRRAIRAITTLAGLFLLTAVSVGSGCATSGSHMQPTPTLAGLIMLGPLGGAYHVASHGGPLTLCWTGLCVIALLLCAWAIATRLDVGARIALVLIWYFLGYYYWAGSWI